MADPVRCLPPLSAAYLPCAKVCVPEEVVGKIRQWVTGGERRFTDLIEGDKERSVLFDKKGQLKARRRARFTSPDLARTSH